MLVSHLVFTRPRRARSRAIRLALAAALLGAMWLAIDPHRAAAGRSALPQFPAHRRALDMVSEHMGSAKAIVDIRRRGRDLDLILWMDDASNLGAIDRDEIAVLSFRAPLRTLILYEHDPAGTAPADAVAAQPVLAEPAEDPASIEHWKLHPDVRSTILAADVSDVSMASHGPDSGLRMLLRIDLKWSEDRADVADRGTVYVSAVRMPREVKELFK
jgi:hypothetical protein